MEGARDFRRDFEEEEEQQEASEPTGEREAAAESELARRQQELEERERESEAAREAEAAAMASQAEEDVERPVPEAQGWGAPGHVPRANDSPMVTAGESAPQPGAPREEGPSMAERAQEQAAAMTERAREQVSEAAGRAREQVSEAATTAREQTSQYADRARSQVLRFAGVAQGAVQNLRSRIMGGGNSRSDGASRNGRASGPALAEQLKHGREEAMELGRGFADIAGDVATLVQQEIQLAKAEVMQQVGKATQAAVWGAAAGLFALLMLVFLFVGVMLAFNLIVDLWIAAFITTGILLALAAIAGLMARQRLKSINLTPQQTIETVKEDIEWVRTHVTSGVR